MCPSPGPAEIRLPHSAVRRGALSYAKLLCSVDPQTTDAFGFRGIFLKPGQRMSWAELHPDPHWPHDPVLLECAGPLVSRRSPPVYILWKFKTQAWRELARACSHDASWTLDLAPIAWRAIHQSKPPRDTAAIATRITSLLDEELTDLCAIEKARVITILHDHLAARSLQVEDETKFLSLKALLDATLREPEK